jgi:alpha-galactosidase
VIHAGTFGCEFDMAAMSPEEATELRELIGVRQRYAPLVQNAELWRLWSPFDRSTPTSADRAAWMFVSADGREALVMAFLITKDRPSSHVPKLRLQGLRPALRYRVQELCPSYLWRNPMNGRLENHYPARPNWRIPAGGLLLHGDTLMHAGVPVSFNYDGDSLCLHLVQE